MRQCRLGELARKCCAVTSPIAKCAAHTVGRHTPVPKCRNCPQQLTVAQWPTGKLAPGDVVTVTRIDRLARSTFDLFGIVKRIGGLCGMEPSRSEQNLIKLHVAAAN